MTGTREPKKGAFMIRVGFLLQGVQKRATRRDPEGYYDIGALIIGIGFWGRLYCSHNMEPPK